MTVNRFMPAQMPSARDVQVAPAVELGASLNLWFWVALGAVALLVVWKRP